LRTLLGDDEYRKLDPNLDIDKIANHASETPAMRELMQSFDDVKKQFTFATPDVRFSLQGELENLDIPGRVNKGLIIIPRYAELFAFRKMLIKIFRATMRRFFDVCIKQIVKLIWEHVDLIERKGSRPKVVISSINASVSNQFCSICSLLEASELLSTCNIGLPRLSKKRKCR
jgi:hypothetical protein